jgi:hypothetical protein
MKKLTLLLAVMLFTSTAAYSWDEPLVATREDIAEWFERGKACHASHMIIVCDRFSYDDFPEYVYAGELPEQRVAYWNGQELYSVMEVYSLHLNMNEQLSEYRAWHLN